MKPMLGVDAKPEELEMAGKSLVFAVTEQDGRVFPRLVRDFSYDILSKTIQEQVEMQLESHKLRGHPLLAVDVYDHLEVDKGKRLRNGRTATNSLKSFWTYAATIN